MSNLKRLMSIRSKNKEKENRNGFDFLKKVLRDGDNRFRAVGEIHIAFEHWFQAADGSRVHSVCTRDYDAELDGAEPNYCEVCKEYKAAWDVYNEPDGHSEEELHSAMVKIGKAKSEGSEFESSWKAKEFAYINIIDREDDVCQEKNHTKVLCKSESQPGISAGNGGILDEIIELADEYGDYEAYDIKIKRTGKKRDTSYRGFKDKERELTPEEKAYERYDFKAIVKPTKAEVVKRWLTEGVKGGEGEGEESSGETEKTDSKKQETKVEKKIETKVERKVETKVEKKEEKKVEPPKGKLAVKKVAEPEPEPEPEQADESDLAECPECSAMISIDSTSCPKCGVEFEGVEE